ncbi:MAG: hypothetical protein ACOYNL_08550 [Rickettsiales bacterium]
MADLVTGYAYTVGASAQVYARIEQKMTNQFGEFKSVFAQFGIIPPAGDGINRTTMTATTRVGISF